MHSYTNCILWKEAEEKDPPVVFSHPVIAAKINEIENPDIVV